MTVHHIAWLVMGAGLLAYAVTAGADFGAGVVHLLARGTTRGDERAVIERAIAPIWEANHVWLIFVIVLVFTAFPEAFAVIGTALHIPLLVALVGIVLRGSAFIFRSYGHDVPGVMRVWTPVFEWSSLLTPIALGAVLAALSSGRIRTRNGYVTTGFFEGWTSLHALLVGLFVLALFVFLAGVYLTVEAGSDERLASAFRKRALASQGAALVVGGAVLAMAMLDPKTNFSSTAGSVAGKVVAMATALAASCATYALIKRAYRVARVAALIQVAWITLGYGLAMEFHLVWPDIEATDTKSPEALIETLLVALAIGACVLVPSLVYLFRLFKRNPSRHAN